MIAARPHTLPAAASPVIVGTGLAIHMGIFALLPAIGALSSAALIQIGTNLANDYYDGKKGVDSGDRDGFTRVTQAGLILPTHVRWAAYAAFTGAMLIGVYLVYVGGIPILVVGLASIASGLLYTGGPYPYGYYGLGDFFVFVFFGVIAVTGTYYVQAVSHLPGIPLSIPPGSIPLESVLASLPMAFLITDILVVNNIRDLESDRAAGKRTLAVIIGYTWSRLQFLTLLILAYIVPIWFWFQLGFSWLVLLPLLTLPIGGYLAWTVVTRKSGDALNPALTLTGGLTVGYAVLFAVGFAI